MATRKKATRRTALNKSKKGKTRAELKGLLKEARAEVKNLLRDEQVRSPKGKPLRAGLIEIERYLYEMGPLEFNG